MNEPLNKQLDKNVSEMKKRLPSEDIFFYSLRTANGTPCTIVYADGIVDKRVLGELASRPLTGYADSVTIENIKKTLPMPELKEVKDYSEVTEEVLAGNAVLLLDGLDKALALGVKSVPMRAITEPPTDVTVRGPRAGFNEEIKSNMALLRTKLKTPDLQFVTVTVGRRSATTVVVCYLDGIAKKEIVDNIERRLKKIDIDGVPDSSYIAAFLSERRYSLFRSVGTTEKPDILAAKMLEGRVGILVDGSPIALTLPYMLVEDFQAADDYFVTPYKASMTRLLRGLALILSIFLPAFYVAAELFKLQLLPQGLLLTVAGSIQGISLSPSLEMILTLLVLEVLTEASIRMPKYVGLALSVVGALVLGDTAVNAGFLSTPAILIIALSGIWLYTVPDFIETTSVIRLVMLLFAGSIGTYGIVLFSAFLLYYLFSSESYGTPLLAPFSPMGGHDLKDSLIKYNMQELCLRPKVFNGKNKVRLKNED